jgi:hypothetical protein
VYAPSLEPLGDWAERKLEADAQALTLAQMQAVTPQTAPLGGGPVSDLRALGEWLLSIADDLESPEAPYYAEAPAIAPGEGTPDEITVRIAELVGNLLVALGKAPDVGIESENGSV